MTLGHRQCWVTDSLIHRDIGHFLKQDLLFLQHHVFSWKVSYLCTNQKQLLFPCQNREGASDMIHLLLTLFLLFFSIIYNSFSYLHNKLSIMKSQMSVCGWFKIMVVFRVKFFLLLVTSQQPRRKSVACICKVLLATVCKHRGVSMWQVWTTFDLKLVLWKLIKWNNIGLIGLLFYGSSQTVHRTFLFLLAKCS